VFGIGVRSHADLASIPFFIKSLFPDHRPKVGWLDRFRPPLIFPECGVEVSSLFLSLNK
jgi:hypothetical protein